MPSGATPLYLGIFEMTVANFAAPGAALTSATARRVASHPVAPCHTAPQRCRAIPPGATPLDLGTPYITVASFVASGTTLNSSVQWNLAPHLAN
jgi:hypothetical protein